MAERPQGGLDFLLSLRSGFLGHHAGEVCLPGGRRELSDGGRLATLSREFEEEVGLSAADLEWLPQPWAVLTSRHGVKVLPHLGFLRSGTARTLRVSAAEVQAAEWLPLEQLFTASLWHPRAIVRRQANSRGEHPWISMEFWQGWNYVTWGLTARMLAEFVRRISGRPRLDSPSGGHYDLS